MPSCDANYKKGNTYDVFNDILYRSCPLDFMREIGLADMRFAAASHIYSYGAVYCLCLKPESHAISSDSE